LKNGKSPLSLNSSLAFAKFLLVVLGTLVICGVRASYPRNEIRNREYGYVTVWAFCCGGAAGLALVIFSAIVNYVYSN
jgi:hypothetical protein